MTSLVPTLSQVAKSRDSRVGNFQIQNFTNPEQKSNRKVGQGAASRYRKFGMGTNMTWRTFSERFVFSVTSKYPGVMAALGAFVGRNPLICLLGPMAIAFFVFTATFNIWSHEARLEELFIPFDSEALTGTKLLHTVHNHIYSLIEIKFVLLRPACSRESLPRRLRLLLPWPRDQDTRSKARCDDRSG